MTTKIPQRTAGLFSAPGRPRNQGARHDYQRWHCIGCGADIFAPPSRISHVSTMHTDRCKTATPEERAAFLKTRRWPKKKKPAVQSGRALRAVDDDEMQAYMDRKSAEIERNLQEDEETK